ncbi:MAG: hypothetical protein RL454_988 [Actinomycetota bacterium]
MPITKVFFGGNAFKIFSPVVRLVTVDVVHLFGGVKILQPASSYNAVHETPSAQNKVSLIVVMRDVWVHISKNFPATRDSVKMVKRSVFNTIHRKANHVVPFWVIAKTSSYH